MTFNEAWILRHFALLGQGDEKSGIVVGHENGAPIIRKDTSTNEVQRAYRSMKVIPIIRRLLKRDYIRPPFSHQNLKRKLPDDHNVRLRITEQGKHKWEKAKKRIEFQWKAFEWIDENKHRLGLLIGFLTLLCTIIGIIISLLRD